MSTVNAFDPQQSTDNYPADNAANDVSNEPLLIFTDNAANKVKELLAEENNPKLKLRVFVSGGGCSGFQYGFTFDEEQNDDDYVIENNSTQSATDQLPPDEKQNDDNSAVTKGSVKLLVDAMSMQYLKGAEIDYKDDESGEQFVIRNPNAQTTCGCGSSFSA